MLNYHIIYSQKKRQNNSQFVHYLSLGSHSSPFQVQHLISLSKITLEPKTSLPKIGIQNKQEQQEIILTNIVVPLYGIVRADNQTFQNNKIFDQTQKNPSTKGIQVIKNCEYISSGDEQKSVFLYFVIDEQSFKQNSQKERSVWTSEHVQTNILSCQQNLAYTTQQNELIYLQKGKIDLKDGNIIKNRGNHKSQNNNLCNLVLFKAKTQIQIQKNTILFSIKFK